MAVQVQVIITDQVSSESFRVTSDRTCMPDERRRRASGEPEPGPSLKLPEPGLISSHDEKSRGVVDWNSGRPFVSSNGAIVQTIRCSCKPKSELWIRTTIVPFLIYGAYDN